MLRRIVQCGALVAVIGGLGVIGAGCLDRPVVTANPETKTTFGGLLAENSVDQLDILFDIDNSASMGDKQALLELAIPDLIGRLVNPNCVDGMGNSSGPSAMGVCTVANTAPEFPAVHDMHLGIVSSSLGTRGGDLCYPTQMTNNGMPFLDGTAALPSHTDDQGHLLARTATTAEAESASTVVGTQNFLDWFPPSTDANDPTATVGAQALTPATVLTDAPTLETDFSSLVEGVHAYGCGIESQMESWYRFLIQPDPYATIAGPQTAATDPAQGSWVGYDQVIIQQRHDFLRPSSLVAIIVLTDENDSEIDTRSFGGAAVNWMVNGATTTTPTGQMVGAFNPPKGTQICETNPADPGCTSCAYKNNPTDPNCVAGNNTYTSPVDWGNDANLRHVHMKQKYGLDRLQYPVERYYLGLTSPTVPNRTMEYPAGAQFYQGGTAQEGAPGDTTQLNCTNPLFAPPLADGSTSLPDGSATDPVTLCNLANPAVPGRSRGAGLVFFAHIGGVPHQLLQAAPGVMDPTTMTITCPAGTAQADCPQKDTLAATDWISILGNGSAAAGPTSAPSYDYTGIDPHMIESYQPRTAASGVLPTGVTALTANAAAAGGGFAEGDPINGNEWVTDTSFMNTTGMLQASHSDLPVDREYACIFPLVDPTTGAATPRDCSNPMDFVNQEACDCSPPTTGAPALVATAPSQIPAVCGQCTATCSAGASANYNLQYFAKTYPTIREIELVHLMGPQGILSSMCPIHPSYANGDTTDPVFGYRPAVTSIINRLKTALSAQCLPERLDTKTTGQCTGPGSNPAQLCVQCLVLVTLGPTDTNTCDTYATMGFPFSDPSTAVAQAYKSQQPDGGSGIAAGKLCQVAQIPYEVGGTCSNDTQLGWCYVEGAAAGQGCTAKNTPQAIVFQNKTLPHGSVASLQCLEQSAAPNADGGGD
jgi:hypothetical protein